jgi:hypothetical protein
MMNPDNDRTKAYPLAEAPGERRISVMLRKLMVLAAALVPLALLPIPSASAATPQLTCNVLPNGLNPPFTAPSCHTRTVTSTYTITYLMQGVTGPASYAWTLPNVAGTVSPGTCTSTINYCAVTASAKETDLDLSASVAVTTADGTTTSYSVFAFQSAVCGNMLC